MPAVNKVRKLACYGKSVFLLLLVAITTFSCSTNTTLAPVLKHNYSIKNSATKYTVKTGDTLYSIAWQVGKDYKLLARWNNILYPYTIYSGQSILLKGKRGVISTKNTSNYPKKRISLKKKNQFNQKVTARTSNNYVKALKLRWQWPLKGKVDRKNASQLGIRIVGKAGSLIKSSERGKVVYAGNGLKGYGNLLIIKHNEEFLSAYGFNKRLLVKEGNIVKKGQSIAEIGLDKNKRYVLFFEIRRNGQPVVPTKYLPK